MCGGWRTGCLLYLFALILSLIFVGINLFDSKLVVRTLQYNTAQSLYLEYHTDVIAFLIFTQVLTHEKWKSKILLLVFLILWTALFVLAVFAMIELLELEYPDEDSVYKVLIIEHARGKDPFFNVHSMFKCCGYHNYTDWRSRVYAKYPGAVEPYHNFSKSDLDDYDVPPSCCRHQFDCGQHLFSENGINVEDSGQLQTRGHPGQSGQPQNTTTDNCAGSDDECTSMSEKIFVRPCAGFVKEYTLAVYLLLQILMGINILLLVCVGVLYIYYYFEDEILECKENRRRRKLGLDVTGDGDGDGDEDDDAQS